MRSNACSLSLSLPNSSSHISFTIGAGLCPLARCRTMFHESSGFSMGYRGFSGWIYIAPSFSMSSETNRILRAIPSPLLTICILQLRPASKALAQTNAFSCHLLCRSTPAISFCLSLTVPSTFYGWTENSPMRNIALSTSCQRQSNLRCPCSFCCISIDK